MLGIIGLEIPNVMLTVLGTPAPPLKQRIRVLIYA